MRDKQPRLGAACIIIADDRIVLGKRARGPNTGKWVLPGGGVEIGETWQSAAEREVKEETGLSVRVANRVPVGVMQIFGPDKLSHRVCLVGIGELVGDQPRVLQCCDELPDLEWVPLMLLDDWPLSEPVRACLAELGMVRP